jgi:carboxyl-terminal processing protease
MLPASNKGVGMNIGFPDVCLTPAGPAAVPIPYPNMAMNAMAVPFCPTILLSCMPALNMGSVIPMTLGMQPGVLNPLYMMAGMYTMGNPKIVLQALPAINLTCPTTGNGMNNAVGAVLVPSVTNVFFTRALPSDADVDDLGQVDRMLSTRPSAVLGELLSEGVGYVRLEWFFAGVASALYDAVRRLIEQGMSSLILDLRDNPGGEMNAFLQLASDFLEQGSELVTMTDVDGDDTIYRAREPQLYSFPIVLLVDRGTASAAELFAGCLRAHGRAIVIGERTYGKGAAQALVASSEKGAVYGTVASFTLPGGLAVQGVGIEPDLPWPKGECERLPKALLDAVLSLRAQ